MEVKLSSGCESFTGSFGSGYGYAIKKTKKGFFSQRNTRGNVPPDGHMRFIFTCAEIARMGLHFSDVKVHALELQEALYEAHAFVAAQEVRRTWDKKIYYNALDIINLKKTFGL